MAKDLDLDVDAPEDVAEILRQAAQEYEESASELESSWQDRGAGKPWTIIARELEKAADRIEEKLNR